MKCPACLATLSPTTYEGVRVFECPACAGYLVGRDRMVLIKARRDRSPEALRAERPAGPDGDRIAEIRCPRCLEEPMRKQIIRAGEGEEFQLDECPACDVVWFEAGELARMQLQFEQSALAVESAARQQRAARLDTDGDDRFERDVAALRRQPGLFSQSLGEIFLCLFAGLFVVAGPVLASFDYSAAAAVSSFLGAALLIKLAVPRIVGTSGRLIAIGLIALIEAVFLAWLLASGGSWSVSDTPPRRARPTVVNLAFVPCDC